MYDNLLWKKSNNWRCEEDWTVPIPCHLEGEETVDGNGRQIWKH